MESNNTKAMREALKRLLNLAYEVQDLNSECEYGPKTSVREQFVIDVAKAALSAPPRNCDVGTPEEQFRRYHKFCMGGHGCSKCGVGIRSGAGCSLAWAQMPYEEGGAK